MNNIIAYENLAASNQAWMPELQQAIQRVLYSGWYILGEEVTAFEQEFARYIGAPYCVGVANGLDALILSIEALELPQPSEILVAANTYIATILAIIRAGHRPVLVEPETDTYNLDPELLPKHLTSKTKAICVTHLFGKPCRMDAIVAFAKESGLRLIEDCAQSHGSKFQGQMTGTFGDAGCFSFYPTKNLGGIGDGGAVVTANPVIAERLRQLRNYGSQEKYVNKRIGVNSRLDELQAAALRVKLPHLDAVIAHKRALAKVYETYLPTWLAKPVTHPDCFDTFHIYAVCHPERERLRAWLLDQGVKTEIHYPIPPHQQEAMRGILKGRHPITEMLHQQELSLPISFGHTVDEIRKVCEHIHQAPIQH